MLNGFYLKTSLNLLTQAQINTHLPELLILPIYSKFLKDILKIKKNLHIGKFILSEVCPALILNKSLFNDFNSFMFSCAVENICDLSIIVDLTPN